MLVRCPVHKYQIKEFVLYFSQCIIMYVIPNHETIFAIEKCVVVVPLSRSTIKIKRLELYFFESSVRQSISRSRSQIHVLLYLDSGALGVVSAKHQYQSERFEAFLKL